MVEMMKLPRKQTFSEELFNAISHGLGAMSAIAALVLMLVRAQNPWQTVSACIYGGSMFFLYMASTLYHSMFHEGAKRVLRVFDHCSIYVSVSYTHLDVYKRQG